MTLAAARALLLDHRIERLDPVAELADLEAPVRPELAADEPSRT